MSKFIVIICLALFITVYLSGCIGPTTGYRIIKLNESISNFINMTEEQMQKFNLLKEAILTNKTIEVPSPSQEITQLKGIFEYFDTNIICYQNEYYEIKIFYAD